MGTQRRLPRRVAAVAGLGAIAAMGMITAGCAGEKEKAPETSTTTTTTTTTTTSPAPPVSETEKAPRINPQAPNLFTPPVVAPPPSQAQPGEHGRHVTEGS